jgi:hypothetical protein
MPRLRVRDNFSEFAGSLLRRAFFTRTGAHPRIKSEGMLRSNRFGYNDRLTASGVMWRGPGAARRPAAV